MAPRKKPHDINVMLRRIARAVAEYPKAAMFELAERGFDQPFQQLVGCILSIRTRDEASLPASLALLERAPTAAAMAKLTEAQIDKLIGTVAFHRPKAKQIRNIARHVQSEWRGKLPCDFDTLTSLPGVGPKCATSRSALHAISRASVSTCTCTA
jgi:endonuclease III